METATSLPCPGTREGRCKVGELRPSLTWQGGTPGESTHGYQGNIRDWGGHRAWNRVGRARPFQVRRTCSWAWPGPGSAVYSGAAWV